MTGNASTLFEEGEAFRNKHLAAQALSRYSQALDLEPDRPLERRIEHMSGVCCQMLHDYKAALGWYALALNGAEGAEYHHIARDKAYALAMLGRTAEALRLLDEGDAYFNKLSQAADYGANRHFRGRVLRELWRNTGNESQRREGLAVLTEAAGRLKYADNRAYELFCLLNLADAELEDWHWRLARRHTLQALSLMRRHHLAGRPQRVRALAQLLGLTTRRQKQLRGAL